MKQNVEQTQTTKNGILKLSAVMTCANDFGYDPTELTIQQGAKLVVEIENMFKNI